MKKTIGIIMLLIIIFLLAFLFLKKEDNKISKIDELTKIVEEKQDKIIYIYNSDFKECNICSDSMKYFEEYQKNYKLDTLDIDCNKLSTEELRRLKNILKLDDQVKNRMNLVYVKEGQSNGSLLGGFSSISIGESLYNQGYLSEEEYQFEVESLNTDIFNLEEKTIVLLGSNNEKINEYKKLVRNIAKNNDLKYRYIEADLAINQKIVMEIIGKIDSYVIPMVLIIENKEITSYTKYVTETDISKLIS